MAPSRAAPLLLLLGAVLAGGACRKEAGGAASARVALSPCRLEGVGPALQCGTVEVWEDRAARSGRRLKLKVAVAPALAPQPEPDPLFILAGGPGQAATDTVGQLLPLLERVRRRRDIVFVDQRGTGGSHRLACLDLPPEADLAEQLRLDVPPGTLEACLEGYDADVRLYTTPIAMDDLDEVRQALGYARINLYGISYGTRAALVYLRQHGQHVRSAVLDGVAPLSLLLPLYMARDGERAFGQLFSHCRRDAACARAYPDLEARFRSLLAQLERAPAEVVAPHPVTGEQTRVRIERDVVAGNLRGLLYTAEVSSLAPLIIDRASRGDWGPFLALTSQLTGGFAKGMSRGMFFSVLCAEDAPFIREEDIVRESAGTLVGEGLARRILQACEVWPRGALPQGYREPVASQVPVLLLSGELDPVTPPSWAEEARATLPNSAHLVVPGVGHNALVHACARGVFRTFLEQGSVEGLPGEGCADAGSRPPFFVNFAGPLP